MLNQLRNRFVAVIMLVTTLLLCVLLVLIYRLTALNLASDHIQAMQSVSDEFHPGPNGPELTRPNNLRYFVLSRTPQGDLRVSGNTDFDLSDKALLVSLYRTAEAHGEKTGVLKDHSLRFVQLEGPGMSYVFADISDEIAALRTLRNSCLILGTVSFLLLLVLSRLLVNRMIRPVEESWQQQRQFVADASHELKTPLTVILTNAELLTDSDYSDTQKREFTDHILTMTLRMRTLVEGMLDLARVDSGVVKTAFESVDFSQLTEYEALPFEPLFFEAGRALEWAIQPGLTVTGSPQHLERVVGILLDNAIKYSLHSSTVVLTLQQRGRHALLCVDSPGQDIPQEELTNIFRRFTTMDRSRSNGSYGLGLSIADGIIREHGGKIWAESGGGHNRFFVRLPLN